MKELTIRELRFCDHFIEHGNADRAFGEAFGYCQATHGYASTARLLDRPEIYLQLLELRAQVIAKAQMGREDLVEKLSNIVRANVVDYYSWDENGDVKLKASDDLTRSQAAAISEVIITRKASGKTTIRIKLHDKIEATKALARMAGYNQEQLKVEHSFVLRAPEVAPSTSDWLESERSRENTRQLELRANTVEVTPAAEQSGPIASPNSYAPPKSETVERAASAASPEPRGIRLDGVTAGRKGAPKRI